MQFTRPRYRGWNAALGRDSLLGREVVKSDFDIFKHLFWIVVGAPVHQILQLWYWHLLSMFERHKLQGKPRCLRVRLAHSMDVFLLLGRIGSWMSSAVAVWAADLFVVLRVRVGVAYCLFCVPAVCSSLGAEWCIGVRSRLHMPIVLHLFILSCCVVVGVWVPAFPWIGFTLIYFTKFMFTRRARDLVSDCNSGSGAVNVGCKRSGPIRLHKFMYWQNGLAISAHTERICWIERLQLHLHWLFAGVGTLHISCFRMLLVFSTSDGLGCLAGLCLSFLRFRMFCAFEYIWALFTFRILNLKSSMVWMSGR